MGLPQVGCMNILSLEWPCKQPKIGEQMALVRPKGRVQIGDNTFSQAGKRKLRTSDAKHKQNNG
jgi:hypothetical protein